MNPVYLINPPPFPFPLIDPNEDQPLQLFSSSSEASASSSSLSNSIFFNPAQNQGGSYATEQHHQHQEINKYVLQGGSSDDHHVFFQSPSLPTVENSPKNSLEISVCEGDDRGGNQSYGTGPVKWMSSKMRLMKKMMNSYRTGADKQVGRGQTKFQDHQQPPSSSLDTDNSSNNSSNNSTVRVCSDCNTTKTPLWRSGPRGPKSLCNACGIRQRKARRAMAAAAAAAASGAVLVNDTSSMKTKVQQREKRSDNGGYVQQYKKRCKLTDPRNRKKLCFEDFTINLSKNSAFHPQDEKEAAILLMALSCGLVHG